ncbi:uncharacterized protein LOC104857494 [Fukomys damarensis]|uniref:uncharacterized protein LOC104857494 n=1 Tax=Fukomys damarensis TaxID=885580 RepID=UPI0014558529|nr:uncharacterized protein LOC104857494 [Fukomys damarensis]
MDYDWLRLGHAPTPFSPSSPREGGRGGSRDQPGASMSLREGSLEDPQADSSVSFLPHLEAKIRQTHSLARLLTKYAEQLLQEYVSENGGRGAKGLGMGEHMSQRSSITRSLNPSPAVEIEALERDSSWLLATQQVGGGPYMITCLPQLGHSLLGA